MNERFDGERIFSGAELREQLLGNLCAMIRPLRIMTEIDRERLAILSGVPEDLIADVEEGRAKFTEAHYLPLSAVFSNAKFTADEKIYRAMVKILLPSEALSDEVFDDFGIIRLWLGTYGEEEDGGPEDSFSECGDEIYDDESMSDGLDPAKIIGDYKLIADETALSDENFPALFTRLETLMTESDSPLAVPESAIEKLREETETSDSSERLRLSSSLKFLRRKQEENRIEILPSSGDYDDAESELLNLIEDSKDIKYLLITQEYRRAAITFGFGNTISAHIDSSGDLIPWEN